MPACLPSAEDAGPARNLARRAQPLLGTLVDIRVAASASPDTLQRAIDGAFACVAEVHALMSCHDPASELSRLNRLAARTPQPLHAHTLAVLRAALRLAAASEGAFDPCVAPLLERQGLLPVQRDADGDTAGDWRDIELLDGNAVRFRRPLRIDLGGIAKGYAVDLALEWLASRLEGQVVVDAGGDLRVAGGALAVRLRDPSSGAPGAQVLELHDQALASSGTRPAQSAGQPARSDHLVDPHSARSPGGPFSVSVVAGDCLHADALTKVVLFAPPALAERVLREHGARAVVQAGER